MSLSQQNKATKRNKSDIHYNLENRNQHFITDNLMAVYYSNFEQSKERSCKVRKKIKGRFGQHLWLFK